MVAFRLGARTLGEVTKSDLDFVHEVDTFPGADVVC